MTQQTALGQTKKATPANWWENDPLAPEQPSPRTDVPASDVTGRSSASGNWWESDPLAEDAQPQRQATQPVRSERTWGEALGDTAVQLAEGVNTIAGAVPNLVAPEGRTAEFFRDNADYWRDKQSDTLKSKIARADEAITAAGEDGVISQIAEAASQYFSDPALAARFVTTNLPSMFPGIAAAKVAQAAALARGATLLRAASIATTAAGATNAVLNAGGARGEAFEDIKRTLEAQGYSPEQAEQMALSDSRVSAAVGALTGFVSGKTGLEGSIVGKAGAGGVVKAGARAAAAELAGEQIEEVTPKLTTNVLASQYDQRSIGQDVGRTVVETAIGSGPGSIVAGGATAINTRALANEAAADPEAQPAPNQGQPRAVPGTSAPSADSNSQIELAMARRTGDMAPARTEPKNMRPEARLAELDILKIYRPLNEVEVQESIALLQEIQARETGEAVTPQAPTEPIAQPIAQPIEQAPEVQAEAGLQAADLEQEATAPAATPITQQEEATPAPAADPAPVSDKALTNFWTYAKERGYTPGQVKKGTQLWTILKADYEQAKASAKPATAPAVNPASILPTVQPAQASAPVAQPINQAPPQALDQVAPIAPAPGIDPALQNRDRSRAASVAQMADIARNPDYMRLATSRTPDAGAPMVFAVGDDIASIPEGNQGRADVAVMADGQRVPFRYAVVDARTVEPSNFADGRVNDAYTVNMPGSLKALNNGRTAGLRAAYEQGTAGNYLAELIADAPAHGVPVEAIQRTPNPILVRVYSEQSNTPDMAAKSQGQGLGMSPTELARQDAPLIDATVLTAYQPGDVTSAANRDFVRAFVGKLNQSGQDVAGMMTAEGTLSPAGRQRIQAALMQAAYGDADLVTELFDSLDTDIKAIGEALKTVAGEWANMRDSARQGLINPDADITDNLVQAVNLVRKARRDNVSLHDLVNQTDLMTGEVPDPLTVGALRFFYPSQYMTRAAGRDAIVSALRDFTRTAMGTTAGADMFGQVVTPSDILNGITEQGATNAQDSTQEGSRGADGRRTDGRSPDATGQGNEPDGNDRAGREAGADRQGEREDPARQVRSGRAQTQEGDEAQSLSNLSQEELLARMGLSPLGTEPTNAERLAVGSMLQKGSVVASAGMSNGITGRVARISLSDQYQTARYFVHLHWHDDGKPRKINSQGGSAYHHDFFVRDGKLYSEDSFGDRDLKQEWTIVSAGQESAATPRVDRSRESPTASRQQPADERIQDVGEQLYANRRNFTGRGLKWEDVESLNDTLKVKEITKAKVWPRPNYEQLVADGMPPVLARMVKHVYDGLSAGPTIKSGTPATDAELKRYIDTLTKVREGLFSFVNDRQQVANFAQGVLTMVKGQATALGPVSILDMAKQSMDAREISTVLLRRVWPEQFAANMPTMGRFTRGSEAQKDVSILGGNKALSALQFDQADIRKWVGDLGKGWPAKREAWQVQGYRVLAPGEYTAAGQEQADGTSRMSIRPKEGRGSWRAVFTDELMANPPFVLVQDGGFSAETFATREAAIEAAREKVKRSPGAGQDIRGTNIEEAERTGPARRQDGEDITPQRLMDAFGFRGVNFGREGWIKQPERQAYLNQAYDGLMDLAEILNVPPKAMSLDGKLGIAFGAQGKGGAHAAHFVPGYNEINLTKTMGAGTLAHEWGHAMDHHFATLAALEKDKEPFLSEHANQPDTRDRMVFEGGKYVRKNLQTFGDGIRPEIVQAFRAIYQAMEKRNESAGEAAARRESAKASALKRLDSWIKAARRVIEESAAENKADLLTEFDQHAEKFREGDTGDGYQKAGKQVFSARVAAVRNLIKDATGRLWSADETAGLEGNASYVKSLLGKQDADTTHEPQKVATQYKADSAAMDREKGGKAYWSTPTEMFARAFELYVHDKLSQREQRNTFLTDAELRANKPVQIPDESSAMARGAGAMRDLYLYPVGKERETLREAFDNLVGQLKTKETDKGLMLYEPDGTAYTGDRYGTTDSRRGADQPAGSARAGSATADGVRGNRGALPGRGRITGLSIAADIERAGSAALIGRTVTTADELAELAQVYRDPRYETFRVFFTRSNRILHATGVSARLPGQAPMVPAGMTDAEYIQAFKDQMDTTGADGYYILHNHPSGDPTPSRADQNVTEFLAAQVPGMKAHVVINSNRYAVIRPGEAVEVKDKDFGPDLLRIPSRPSPILNTAIGSPDDLVTLGKSLQKPGWMTLIGTDSSNRVRLTADVPTSALSREPRVLAGQVRRLMRQSGSRHMHLIGSDADVASKPVQDALSQGILRDAVGTTGRTMAERGMSSFREAFALTKGRMVAEGAVQTDSAAFKRWFGDSKVVDAEGKPLVVYHGTPYGGFDSFDPAKSGTRDTFDSARAGFYFSKGTLYAGVLSRSGDETGPAIYPVYLSIQNPLRVFTTELTEPAEVDQMIADAKRGGHDGIIDEMGNFVAFRQTQIKSAIGNRGTFDPSDPSIVREDKPGYRGIYSTTGRSVPLAAGQGVVEATVAQEVEQRIGQFAHQPTIVIRGSAEGVLPGATKADGVAGAVHDSRIFLFLDQLATRADVQETLFHELFHYGVRRIFTRDQFIQEMRTLYDRDAWVKARADAWVKTKEGKAAALYGGDEYALARGVDETLARLAEPNAGAYTRTDAFNQAIVSITRWLADLAQRLGFTDFAAKVRGIKNEEARELIQRVFRTLETQANPDRAGWMDDAEPAFSRNSIGGNEPPQIQPEQASAWTRAKAKAMELTSPTSIDKLIYEFQDKYIDLKRLRDHIKTIGGTITDLNDAYLGEELYHKRLAKRTEDFLDKELKPLLADMRSRSVSLPELERYLHARHAPEANKALAERNPNRAMIDAGKERANRLVKDLQLQLQRAKAQGSATKAIEDALNTARDEAANWNGAQAFRGTEEERLALSGMSDAEAKAYMDSLTPRKRENLKELADRVDLIQSKTLDTLVDYGLMDRPTITGWRSQYQFYVPLHRDEAHAESDRHPIGQGFSVKGTGMKSRVGSNEKVTNILAHIAMQRETALTRGEKNHVVKKLYLMAAQNPDEEFWEIDRPAQIKTIDPRNGFVRTMVDPRFKHLPNVVMVRIGGRDQAIVFNEHNPQAVRLAEAMKNLDVGDLHVVLGLASKGTRWFASVNTQYNPIFGLINFARDVQAGLLNLSTTELAGKSKEVASHVFTAMRAIYRERRGKGAVNPKWAKLWDEFQDVGGTTGYRDLFTDASDRANALGKELAALDRGEVSKAAHAVVDWLSDYNETMENAVRLAAYKVALDQGMTKERAASLAKNITVNFNRKGRQAREIGALYAFFNASLQGTARMVETLRGPVGKRIMYGGVLLGVVNTLIGMAMMGADDDDEADNWEQIPEFIKERSIIIPLGREDYVTIPMPLGFHVFPNIGRIATEYALGDSDKSLGRQIGKLLLAMTDAFNPLGGSQNLGQLVAPTVIDPVVALMQNRDWTGKPIYRENANGLDPQPGHMMAKDSASTPSRAVAEAINKITGGTDYRPGAWSPTPDQLDYVIGQLTGGLGRELLKVNQTIASTVTGDELPPYKVPLVGRLYGNTRGPAGQSEQFYENVKLLNEIENEYKGRLRNREDVNELRDTEPLVRLIGLGNGTELQVRKLREMRRKLVERKDPGYQERAKEIDVRIGEAMTRLNTEVAKARREGAR